MATLLVRNIDESLVKKLKRRALEHEVSAEEEHRRILKGSLSRDSARQRSLMEFLLQCEVEPDVELDLSRSRAVELRDTGI